MRSDYFIGPVFQIFRFSEKISDLKPAFVSPIRLPTQKRTAHGRKKRSDFMSAAFPISTFLSALRRSLCALLKLDKRSRWHSISV
jgi:hypothetical protein